MIEKNNKLFVPKNLDLEYLAQKNPPNFKPFKLDKLKYILSLISELRVSNKDLLFEDYTPINASLLQKKIQNYKDYLNYLIDDLRIVKSDNSYVNNLKSRGYRFENGYNTFLKTVDVTDISLSKAIDKDIKKSEVTLDGLDYLTKWYNDKLKIDYTACKEFLDREYELKIMFPELRDYDMIKKAYRIPLNQYNSSFISLSKIYTKQFFLKRDSNVYRFHSNLTNVSSILRNAITYDGQKLVNIDITNSQPYFSSILFKSDFWKKSQKLSSTNNNVFNISNIKNNNLYIMLGDIESPDVTEDIIEFVDLACQGRLYEVLQEKFKKIGFEFSTRNDVKKAIFQVLFTSNQFIGQPDAKPKKLFSEIFPHVYRFFNLIKKGDKTILPRLLQSIESYVVIDVLCKKIEQEHPEIPIFPIHDSIATTVKYRDVVKKVMLEECHKLLGIPPVLKFEYWEKDLLIDRIKELESKIETNTFIVYKATNILTNEVYIGASTKSLKERVKDHKYKSTVHNNRKFYNAINTYGFDNFRWEQIDTASNLEELAFKEKSYIVEYNSKLKGYNSDCGGGFSKIVYQYSKEGVLLDQFDSLNDAAAKVTSNKQQISRACLTSNIYKGFVWSYNDSFESSKIEDRRTKKVFQYSLNDECIGVFDSVAEASSYTGFNRTSIAKVCRGERNKCGEFKWSYE